MISDFKDMNKLFEEIDRILKDKVCLFAIGGVTLLYHGMKRATKDIDLIAETKKEFDAFHDALKLIGFQTMIPPRGVRAYEYQPDFYQERLQDRLVLQDSLQRIFHFQRHD